MHLELPFATEENELQISHTFPVVWSREADLL